MLSPYALTVTVAIGDPVRAVDRIPESYSHALEALEHRILSTSPLLLYQERSAAGAEATCPSHLVEAFSSALATGNEAVAQESFNSILRYGERYALPVFTVRALCFDCVQALAAAHERIETPLQPVPRIERDESLHGFAGRLESAISRFFEAQKLWREARDADRTERLRRYVRDNYDDPAFCLQKTADEFSMSPSNLSHQFKSAQGVTFAEYVKGLRLEKAKRLLSHTGMPVSEIVRDVGYTNASSFVRTFRESTAMTPTQFRRRYTAT